MILEGLLFLIALVLFWYYKNQLPTDYPATPPLRIPIYGHLPYFFMIGGDFTKVVDELYKRYAKDGMLALHSGSEKLVMIGDHKLIQEAMRKEETNYRVKKVENNKSIKKERSMPEFAVGSEGIVNNYGKPWQEQRRFMLTTMKDFGFGKAGMGDLINDEIDYFRSYLAKKADENNGILVIQNFFNIAILNVLWKIISGERYVYTDSRLSNLVDGVSRILSTPESSFSILNLLPFLRPIFRKLGLDTEVTAKCKEDTMHIRNFLEETIKKHRENFDANEINDFIDSYLLAIQQTQDPSSSFSGQQGQEQLVNVLIDLFLAGSETTSSTLSWATLFMVRNPNVQKRVRAEIHEVIGTDRLPGLSDRQQMPYTEATIMEIQRVGNIAPYAVQHATMKGEIKVGAFTIPKEHNVIAYLTNVMKSEAYWDKPLEFRPERHLGPDGKVVRSELLIPWYTTGTGKRQCPGESLARAELFLFITGLMQKFDFAPEDPNNLPTTEAITGITSMPKPYKIKLASLY